MNYDTNNEFTLLSDEQTFGSRKIDIIEKLGTKCAISDFAILLGSYVSYEVYVDDDDVSLKGRTAAWCLSSFDGDGDVRIVNGYGDCKYVNAWNRSYGIRPVIPFDTIDIFAINLRSKGILEVVYGEYPQYAVDSKLGGILENEFSAGRLKKTGKTYTTDSRRWDAFSERFSPAYHEEFEYNGKRYVRVKSNDIDENFKLTNGVTAHPGDYFWLEVSPILWHVDEKAKMLVSKILLASGIRFCDNRQYKGDFETTEMYMFLNEYFAKDIIPSNINENTNIQSSKNKTKKLEKKVNPYGFDFDKVKEEDIIKGAIESGVAVFLHGPSSEGKSARVKQIDQTCEIIYLRNASPESLNGKSVYNQETGEMIDVKPTWLKKVEAKCESEPDRLHVVFFDEITNALPSIQGIAFNIVLDREVNGIWKLPENARIVASGNEMEDSLAANQLAEPLFNRFAHVYIKTTTESWLKWASENGIHPAIYTFMAYKKGTVLRRKFDGEKPNADPRKWEMASKMLYATGKPEMIRSLIGEDITKEFIAFCKTQVITLDDVINDDYDESEVQKLNTAEKHATAMTLSQVDENNLEKVRKFVKKLGGECRAIFDTLWVHNDEERLEKIALLEQEDNVEINNNDNSNENIADIELTLLSEAEIWGDNQLDVLKKYGTRAAVTDLAIMTGSNYSSEKILDNISLRGLSGSIFTSSTTDNNGNCHVTIVHQKKGVKANYNRGSRCHAIRPVIKSPEIFLEVFPDRVTGFNETYEVAFGEYPQYAASQRMQIILESAYLRNVIGVTGKYYTFDGRNINTENSLGFQPETYAEYEYDGKRYIRFIVKYIHNNDSNILSNEIEYKIGDGVWLEVEPIIWLIDGKTQTLISKRGLISGIRFDNNAIPYGGDFKTTEMYKYLNTYLNREIISSTKQKLIKKVLKK